MAVMAGKDGLISVASKRIGYIDNSSINVNVGTGETSQIGKTWKEFIPTAQDWSGSLSGTLDYADEVQKQIVDQIVAGSVTTIAGEFKVGPELTFTGSFIVTSVSVTMSHPDKVAVSFNFQGTGELTKKAGAGA